MKKRYTELLNDNTNRFWLDRWLLAGYDNSIIYYGIKYAESVSLSRYGELAILVSILIVVLVGLKFLF